MKERKDYYLCKRNYISGGVGSFIKYYSVDEVESAVMSGNFDYIIGLTGPFTNKRIGKIHLYK